MRKASAERLNMASLCRTILTEVGPCTSFVEAEAWVEAHRPGCRYNRNSLRSTLTAQRRVLKRGGRVAAVSTTGELVRLAQLTKEYGGTQELRARVQEVLDIAREFGGIKRVLASLDRLERLL
jgi:hypothetical protein